MLGLAGLGEARKKSACGRGSEAPAAQAERKGCCLQAAAGALGAEVAAYAAAGARHEEDAARRARGHVVGAAAAASLRGSASGAVLALHARPAKRTSTNNSVSYSDWTVCSYSLFGEY